MARPLRMEFAGAFYHVMARGNERRDIFRDDRDYAAFLRLLARTVRRHGLRPHAYVLMPNHYHLLMETPRPELSAGLHWLNGVYGQYFNRRHDRVGHLFQGRFKSLLVQRERYLLALSRYIHRNPVRAGLAELPWVYPWSSCAAFLGIQSKPEWLETAATLRCFGDSAASRQRAYRRFVHCRSASDSEDAFVSQGALGDADFLEKMRLRAEAARAARAGVDRMERVAARPSLDAVLGALRRVLGVSAEELSSARWRHDPTRDLVAHLLRERAALPVGEIAARMRLSSARVSQLTRRCAGRLRTDPALRESLRRLDLELGIPEEGNDGGLAAGKTTGSAGSARLGDENLKLKA